MSADLRERDPDRTRALADDVREAGFDVLADWIEECADEEEAVRDA